MKRNNLKIILTFLLLFSTSTLFSQGLDVGFHIGLSTPNDKIADVYNKNKVTLNDSTNSIGKFLNGGMDAGYHIGVKGRIELSDNADFVVGFGLHRFPETDIKVTDPQDPTKVLATLTSTTNVVPINAGLNFYLMRSFIGLYATGDLTYNYISSSLDYKGSSDIPIPLTKSPTDSRLGFGFGAGMDISLGLIMLNLEAKYNYLNLIGKEEDEGNKSFLSFGLGVYF